MRGRAIVCGMALAVLAVAGCAGRGAAPNAAAVPVHGQTATIVAIRPASPALSAAVLAALGGAGVAQAPSTASEFVLRDDTGRTVTVMQVNQDRLRPGEHVRLGARLLRLTS